MKRTRFVALITSSRLLHILVVFLLALVIRMVYLYEIHDNPFFDHLLIDENAYDQWAQRIAAGEWLGNEIFYQDPLYPYFLGVIYSTIGRDYLWARVIQLVIGSATCVLIYLIGKSFFNDAVGVTAGIMAALYKPFFYFEAMFLKSFLAVFLLCLFIVLLAVARSKRSFLMWTVAGLVLGMLALVRANTLALAGGVLVWLALSGRESEGVRYKLIAFAGFLAGLMIVTMSVCARNYVVGKDIVLLTSQGGQNFLIGNNPWNRSGRYEPPIFVRPNPRYEQHDFLVRAETVLGRKLKPSEASRYWFGEAFRFIRQQPRQWLKLLWLKTRIFWNWYEVPDNQNFYFFSQYSSLLRLPLPDFRIVAALGLSGMVFSLAYWRKLLLLHLTVILYSGTVILFYVFDRYKQPVVPALIVFAAYLLSSIPGMIAKRNILKLLLAISLPAIFYFLFGTHVSPELYYSDSANAYSRLGGVYLAEGDLDKALQAYRQSVQILPYHWTGYYGLGQTYDRKREFDLALENYTLARIHNPGNPDICEHMARIYYLKGEFDKSEELYREAVNLKPDWPKPYYMLAVLYKLRGDHEQAELHLRKWKELRLLRK
ncbi:MAG: tetratricopeptide repeat protein [Candidatus Abyssubacteria bacterium]